MPLSLLNLALFAACDQTKVVGQYLSSLASSGYDHFTRPNGLNGAAEQIEVQLKVLHLKNVDHMSNRVSLLAFFRRYWVDPRLAFAGTPAEDCNRDISVPTLTALHGETWNEEPIMWQPDFTWLYSDWTPLSASSGFFRISPDGSVYVSSQMTLDVECAFNFHLFPYDEQTCYAKLGLYRENNASGILTFKQGNGSNAMQVDLETYNYEWAIVPLDGEQAIDVQGTGAESRVLFHFTLLRRYTCYTEIILMCYFMGLIAYPIFWFPPDGELDDARLVYSSTMVLANIFFATWAMGYVPPHPGISWLVQLLLGVLLFNLVALFQSFYVVQQRRRSKVDAAVETASVAASSGTRWLVVKLLRTYSFDSYFCSFWLMAESIMFLVFEGQVLASETTFNEKVSVGQKHLLENLQVRNQMHYSTWKTGWDPLSQPSFRLRFFTSVLAICIISTAVHVVRKLRAIVRDQRKVVVGREGEKVGDGEEMATAA